MLSRDHYTNYSMIDKLIMLQIYICKSQSTMIAYLKEKIKVFL